MVMPTIFKKLTLIFLSTVLFLNSMAMPFAVAKAQNSWYDSSFPSWYDKVYNENTSPQSEIFGERYTAGQVQWIEYSLLTSFLHAPFFVLSLFGIETPSPNPWACILGVTSGTADIATCTESTINSITTIFKVFDKLTYDKDQEKQRLSNSPWNSILYENRDLSFISYIRNISNKFNIVEEAQAQTAGFGYGKLLPISGYWQLTRNISYTLFVLIIIAIAFMIMFKVKISPQASVSIMSSVPKIASTLLLITFSLAIAGLLMDLMYVFIGLLASMLPTITGATSFTESYNFLIGGYGSAEKDGLLGIFITFLVYIITYFVTSILITLSAIVTGNLTSIIFGVLMIFFTVIMVFILIYNWLKIIYVLVKTVAMIYVSVIMAPLQLMMDVLPPPLGGKSFSGWLKGLIGKLLVFPLTGVLIFFSFKLLGTATQIAASGVDSAYGANTAVDSMVKACEQMSGSASLCNFFYASGVDASYWGAPWLGNAGAITGIIFLLMSVMCIMAVGNASKIIDGALAGKLDLESAINEPIKVGGTAAAGALKEGAVTFPYSKTVGSTIEQFVKNLR
jgi:hypothetical protein